MTGTQRDAINILKMMDSVTVNADLIAKAEGKNPGVLRKQVRDGQFHKGDPDICRTRIRFNRKKYLQDIGEIPPDQPERTTIRALDDLREELHDIGLILLAQMSGDRMIVLDLLKEHEKTAGAATPTD